MNGEHPFCPIDYGTSDLSAPIANFEASIHRPYTPRNVGELVIDVTTEDGGKTKWEVTTPFSHQDTHPTGDSKEHLLDADFSKIKT